VQSLSFHVLLLFISAAVAVLATSGWLRTAGTLGGVAAVLAYTWWMHSVLRFTKK